MANPSATAFLKTFEGCRLTAYQDQGGAWTIGYGHTGPEVHAGLTWTQAQADAALVADSGVAEAALNKQLKVALSEKQGAALISFVFNLGAGALASSHLLVLLNARDWLNAAREFQRWSHIGQVDNKGLLTRRLEEAVLFLKGT